jgi:hypothetical protein
MHGGGQWGVWTHAVLSFHMIWSPFVKHKLVLGPVNWRKQASRAKIYVSSAMVQISDGLVVFHNSALFCSRFIVIQDHLCALTNSSWACTFIQFPVLKAEGLSACYSRSERVPAHIEGRACVCICLPVSRSRVQRVCACVCTYQKLSVCLRVFARCEGWTCLSMCMQALRAGSVAAYVWACWELRVCLRVFARVESLASFCNFLRWRRIFIIIYKNRCWPVSSSERCTHVSICIKSLAFICMCWFGWGWK